MITESTPHNTNFFLKKVGIIASKHDFRFKWEKQMKNEYPHAFLVMGTRVGVNPNRGHPQPEICMRVLVCHLFFLFVMEIILYKPKFILCKNDFHCHVQ